MSGAAFEGLEGILPAGEREQYEPGLPGVVGRGWIEPLIDAYLRGEFSMDYDYRREDAVKDIRAELEGVAHHGEFDANRFLDTLLLRTSLTMEEKSILTLATLMNPLLQALYELGHNGFMLDMREMPFVNSIANGLQGTPERPLELSLIGMWTSDAFEWPCLVHDIGSRTEHCIITMQGDVNMIGRESIRSEYIIDGAVYHLGIDGAQCTYRLTNPDSVRVRGYGWKHQLRRAFGMRSKIQVLSSVRKEAHPSITAYATYLEPDFFGSGNTLLVPDGAGGWKEVTP